MVFAIQEIRREQVDVLKPLMLECHKERVHVSGHLAPFVPGPAMWTRRRATLLDLLGGNGRIFIAVSDDRVVGASAASIIEQPWAATFDCDPLIGELPLLYVLPACRRKGYGTQLLETMRRALGGIGVRDLVVGWLPTEAAGHAFCARHGFKPAWITLTRFGAEPETPMTPPVWARAVLSERVWKLREAWLTLHHHHQAVSPNLGPWVSDADSWKVFEKIFTGAADEGLLWIAGDEDDPDAVLSARTLKGTELFSDTWPSRASLGEVAVLIVEPERRGTGIGEELMRLAAATMARKGAIDLLVGAIAPNARAIQFYERIGYARAWLEMTRFMRAT